MVVAREINLVTWLKVYFLERNIGPNFLHIK